MWRVFRHSDVVLLSGQSTTTFLAWVLATIMRRPVYAWVHFDWREYRHVSPTRTRFQFRIYCRRAKVIACSRGVSAGLAEVFGCLGGGMNVIPNAIDHDRSIRLSEASREQWSQRVFEHPVVVSVSRLAAPKDPECIIRAHALLKSTGVRHNLLILGGGPLRGQCELLAAQLGVADSVFLPGYVSNPYPYLKAAAVFVHASHFEGLPLAMLEAMGLGLPVVATDCPSGPDEILEGGRHGALVPVSDPTAMAEQIGKMLQCEATRRKWASRALARAQFFGAANAKRQWYSVLFGC